MSESLKVLSLICRFKLEPWW